MSEFLESMPAAYASAFDAIEINEHARIVARRGGLLVHAEIFVGRAGPQVCLVTDDRPGLLALVTDALLVHGLNIRNAQVYCRRRNDGQFDAVDFFQLEQEGVSVREAGISAAELAAFVQTLSELVAEQVLASRVSSAPSSGAPKARVYFELEALRRGEFALLVEAPDSPALLNGITSALHDQDVRILSSQIRTEAGFARDRFELVSNDGEPLGAVRLCDIQQAVLEALPPPARRSRPGVLL
jgi:[protein-PII] uridylyltransferase